MSLGGCSAFLGELWCAEAGDLGARVGFMLVGSFSFPFVLVVCVDGLVLRFLILVLVSTKESSQGYQPDVLLGYQWRVGWMIRSVCEEFA